MGQGTAPLTQDITSQLRENALDALEGNSGKPDISEDRLERICEKISTTTMGRAMMDHFFELKRKNRKTLSLKFDSRLFAFHGVCFNREGYANIGINPRLKDAFVTAVTMHELRHAMQPVAQHIQHFPNTADALFFRNRLIEGDALTHQIVFGLELKMETGDGSTAIANENYCRHDMTDAQFGTYKNLCATYEQAATDEEKRHVMRALFFLTQESILNDYDDRFLEMIEEKMMENLARDNPQRLNNPKETLEDLCLFEVMRLQKTPNIVAGCLTDHYLGNDELTLIRQIFDLVPAAIKQDLQNLSRRADHALRNRLAEAAKTNKAENPTPTVGTPSQKNSM